MKNPFRPTMKNSFRPIPTSFGDMPSHGPPPPGPGEIPAIPPKVASLIRNLIGVDPAEVLGLLQSFVREAEACKGLLMMIAEGVARQEAELDALRQIVRNTVPEAHYALSESERELMLLDPEAAARAGQAMIEHVAKMTGQSVGKAAVGKANGGGDV